ncbi:hypothetical protein ACFYM5_04200 [Streptomyces sp. NPDC006706]|uniref:hypothetical protein n=1 Tax=Streptomyces sp. NPDC006706 TaxID=3364761 RepID=UPI003692D580
MDHQLDAGTGDWAAQGDCPMAYHCAAPGFASISHHYGGAGLRVVAGFPSPVSYEEVRIFRGVANERDFKGASLEECLRVEEMVYLEDLPITANIEPREVPWDAEVPEFSAPADLFDGAAGLSGYGGFTELGVAIGVLATGVALWLYRTRVRDRGSAGERGSDGSAEVPGSAKEPPLPQSRATVVETATFYLTLTIRCTTFLALPEPPGASATCVFQWSAPWHRCPRSSAPPG